MPRHTKYHTINRSYFLQTAQSFRRPFTAKDIAEKLEKNENPLGTSTIYRLLDEFSSDGTLRKGLAADNSTSYFYMKPCKNENHFYLECNRCKRMFHVDCRHLRSFSKHIAKKHFFQVSGFELVINGVCANCQKDA